MHHCTQCGKQNRDTAKFCTNCGSQILSTAGISRNDPVQKSYRAEGRNVSNGSNSGTYAFLSFLYKRAGLIGSILASVSIFGTWIKGWGPSATGLDILASPQKYIDEKNTFGGGALIQILLILFIIASLMCLRYASGMVKKDPDWYKISRLGVILISFFVKGLISNGSKMQSRFVSQYLTTNADFSMYKIQGWGASFAFWGSILLLLEIIMDKYFK